MIVYIVALSEHWLLLIRNVMSDDEVISFPVRTKVVHYGSLEDQIATFKDREDEHVRVAKSEVMDTEDNESEARQELLEEFEKRKKVRIDTLH